MPAIWPQSPQDSPKGSCDALIPFLTLNMLPAPFPESSPSGSGSCLGLRGGFQEVYGSPDMTFQNVPWRTEGPSPALASPRGLSWSHGVTRWADYPDGRRTVLVHSFQDAL